MGNLNKLAVVTRQLMPVVIIAVLAGCAGSRLAGVGAGGDEDALARGKRLYYTRCAQCHSALPVKQYSLEQWESLLPPMIRKSKLDATQGAELSSYVRATLRLPP